MTITYNKLVRDRIPEIITASGKTCTTEILSEELYLKLVDAKLDEELAEYRKDQNTTGHQRATGRLKIARYACTLSQTLLA